MDLARRAPAAPGAAARTSTPRVRAPWPGPRSAVGALSYARPAPPRGVRRLPPAPARAAGGAGGGDAGTGARADAFAAGSGALSKSDVGAFDAGPGAPAKGSAGVQGSLGPSRSACSAAPPPPPSPTSSLLGRLARLSGAPRRALEARRLATLLEDPFDPSVRPPPRRRAALTEAEAAVAPDPLGAALLLPDLPPAAQRPGDELMAIPDDEAYIEKLERVADRSRRLVEARKRRRGWRAWRNQAASGEGAARGKGGWNEAGAGDAREERGRQEPGPESAREERGRQEPGPESAREEHGRQQAGPGDAAVPPPLSHPPAVPLARSPAEVRAFARGATDEEIDASLASSPTLLSDPDAWPFTPGVGAARVRVRLDYGQLLRAIRTRRVVRLLFTRPEPGPSGRSSTLADPLARGDPRDQPIFVRAKTKGMDVWPRATVESGGYADEGAVNLASTAPDVPLPLGLVVPAAGGPAECLVEFVDGSVAVAAVPMGDWRTRYACEAHGVEMRALPPAPQPASLLQPVPYAEALRGVDRAIQRERERQQSAQDGATGPDGAAAGPSGPSPDPSRASSFLASLFPRASSLGHALSFPPSSASPLLPAFPSTSAAMDALAFSALERRWPPSAQTLARLFTVAVPLGVALAASAAARIRRRLKGGEEDRELLAKAEKIRTEDASRDSPTWIADAKGPGPAERIVDWVAEGADLDRDLESVYQTLRAHDCLHYMRGEPPMTRVEVAAAMRAAAVGLASSPYHRDRWAAMRARQGKPLVPPPEDRWSDEGASAGAINSESDDEEYLADGSIVRRGKKKAAMRAEGGAGEEGAAFGAAQRADAGAEAEAGQRADAGAEAEAGQRADAGAEAGAGQRAEADATFDAGQKAGQEAERRAGMDAGWGSGAGAERGSRPGAVRPASAGQDAFPTASPSPSSFSSSSSSDPSASPSSLSSSSSDPSASPSSSAPAPYRILPFAPPVRLRVNTMSVDRARRSLRAQTARILPGGDPAVLRVRRAIRRAAARRAGLPPPPDEHVFFDDVAGANAAKRDLIELVDVFANPERYHAAGARAPRGVLLTGPPGTGKTLLARAVAAEAGVTFLSVNSSEFVEIFAGVGAMRVREAFGAARTLAPAVVFFDELDAVGRARGGAGGSEEREQTVNQMLVEMDGFGTSLAVVAMAATNRPDVLDPALVRPGRFDRRVEVPLPSPVDRLALLRGALRAVRADDDLDAAPLAERMDGASGAVLAALASRAASIAATRGSDEVQLPHLLEAVDRSRPRRRWTLFKRYSLEAKRRLALYESAFCLAAFLQPSLGRVGDVSIVPRGASGLGATTLVPGATRAETGAVTGRFARETLTALLAPREAERRLYGDAGLSVAHRKRLADARAIAARAAFVDALPGAGAPAVSPLVAQRPLAVALGSPDSPIGHVKVVAPDSADDAVLAAEDLAASLLATRQEDAKELVARNWDALLAIRDALVESGELTGAQVEEIARAHANREDLEERDRRIQSGELL